MPSESQTWLRRDATDPPDIETGSVTEALPPPACVPLLVNQEQNLLFHEVNGLEASPRHQFAMILRITGPFDTSALESALQTLVTRHAALRTAFIPNPRYNAQDRAIQLGVFRRTRLFISGLYVQVVHRTADLLVDEHDVDCDAQAAARIDELAKTPLRLNAAPLMRATVIRVNRVVRYLSLVMSHLVVDQWAVRLLIGELKSLYLAIVAGSECHLPSIQLDYPDFVLGQHAQCRAGFTEEYAYWERVWTQLDGALIRHCDLPIARSTSTSYRPPTMDLVFARVPPDASAVIRTALAGLSLTPYTFFRAALAIVLHGCMDKSRLAFWANFANRTGRDIQQTVGWCSNTNIVTTDVNADTTCLEFCRQMSKAVYDAVRHQALPLPALWRRLSGSVDAFDTRVNFDSLGKKPPSGGMSIFELSSIAAGLPTMDLDVRIADDAHGFELVACYDSNRYERSGVHGLLASVSRVAARMAMEPRSRVASCMALLSI